MTAPSPRGRSVHLLTVGVDHHRAPLDVRTRLALEGEKALALLETLHRQPWADEVLCLATCNRTEVSVVSAACSDPDLLLRASLALMPHAPPPEADYYLRRTDDGAARHLLRVAAGLESAILGETEIQGQVRRALDMSRSAATLGPVLDRLGQCALRGGRRVRAQTHLSAGGISYGTAVVRVLEGVFGGVKGREIVVVGAGEMARGVLHALSAHQGARYHVVNRNVEAARQVLESVPVTGESLSLEGLEAQLEEADVAIFAAPVPRLDAALLGRLLRRRREALLVFDLCVPRVVAAEARTLPGIFLYDLEGLERLVADALAVRRSAIPAAEAIVHQELEAFRAWLRTYRIAPAIRSMHEWAEAIRQEEMAHLPPALDPESRRAVERLTRRLVRRLLGRATQRVVEGARAESEQHPTVGDLHRVFGLKEDDS